MSTNPKKNLTAKSSSQRKQKRKMDQSQGEASQSNLKNPSKVATKTKKGKDTKKIMLSDEFTPLRFKVVSNHLNLKNIMSHMTFSTLKTARLVSKDWKKLANLELERRNCCKTVLWGFFEKKLEFLRNSDDISWMEFDFAYFKEEELEDVAAACGSQVKMMKMYPCQTFWDLLGAEKFPNLEILSLCEDNTKGFHDSTTPLKRVSNPNSGDIISALANLKRIEEINLSDASLVPSKIFEFKGHLFKSAKLENRRCSCCANSSTSLNLVTVLAQANPKLERFDIRSFQDGSEFLKQIYLILESSRDSLVQMSFPYIAYSYKLKFSQPFQRLSTFHIGIDSSSGSLIHWMVEMLESFNQDCLPNLKTVKFQFSQSYSSYSKYYASSPKNISTTGKLSSVVNLELLNQIDLQIYDLVPSHWFPLLSNFFPNVQNLTIGSWKDVDQVLLQVFTGWPKLISLKLRLRHAQERVELDPVLTGLSLEKCEELRKVDPEKMMTEDVLTCRTWPNLHSLTELKQLDIVLRGGFTWTHWCPVSPISCLYAMNLKPEFRATIRFVDRENEYRRFIEHLAPYARLEELLEKWSIMFEF